jgi:hypothetical protein
MQVEYDADHTHSTFMAWYRNLVHADTMVARRSAVSLLSFMESRHADTPEAGREAIY